MELFPFARPVFACSCTNVQIFELADASNEVILLATSDKLLRQGPFAIGPISLIATLVTDSTADPSILERIRNAGVEVIVAGDQNL